MQCLQGMSMQQRQYGSGISAARTIEMRHRIKKARWKIQLYQIKNQMPREPPSANQSAETARSISLLHAMFSV